MTMTMQDRITIGGFISLGALVVALGGLTFVQIDGVEARLNSRIDGVEERLNSRIDEVEERLNSRIDGVEERLNSRIDGVEERLNSRIDGLNSRIDEGEARMARLEEAVRELGERMARFEGTLSAVAALVGLNETPDEPGRERLPPGRP